MQELNIYGLWAGKQTAKGTPAATLDRRFVQVAGDFSVARDQGSEAFSDLSKYGDATDWINSVLGNGNPGIEATPVELAWLLYIFHGGETTTAVVGPPAKTKHTFKPSTAPGFFSSWFRRVGLTQIVREQFQDVRIGQVVIAGSTAAKAIRVTPTALSLDPAVVKAADPAAALPTLDPFLFTDGTGRFKLDTVVFEGHSAFELTINEDLSPVFGDDVVPHELVGGSPGVGISVTCYLDADGLAQVNKLLYGTPTPAADAKPLKTVPALGSYEFDLQARNNAGAATGDKVTLNVPGVRWNLPDRPAPNPGGGAAELTLTGSMRPIAGQDPYTIAVDNSAAAFA